MTAVGGRALGASANAALLAWYEPRSRAYPWRRGRRHPYRTLVSEVMLQQTQARRVAAAFAGFVRTFPNVRALAAASRADVVRAWGGLGYNRRALALHAAAREVVRSHHGRIPSSVDVLRALPGVGPYTAAAVASLAFGIPVPAIDTNVRRVLARAALGVDATDVDARTMAHLAVRSIDRARPGAWNEALMDVGRTACRPKPRCSECPLSLACALRRRAPSSAPRARPKAAFVGSSREARGAVVRALRSHDALTIADLVAETRLDVDRIQDAVARLGRDGLVSTSAASERASARAVVRLAR